MAPSEPSVMRLITAEEVAPHIPSLAIILKQNVDTHESLGFRLPFALSDATSYWAQVSQKVSSGSTRLFIYIDPETSTALGTVQYTSISKATHVHRAEVAKLLVAPLARRRGVAKLLMAEMERFAKEEDGKLYLSLDTACGSTAELVYKKLGWREFGKARGYAMSPTGERHNVTFFEKELGEYAVDL
jgi:GNAT superfamily N-acetyltransferase